ncbi:MAG: HipA domain-containing protein [Acidimicrobiaceae bacterium]|nr:HipA domain-containing protein [Acidimicrobiaceae bacterium]MDE0606379.1 HipA domain-containing protein [Acidimicrobiaceae bacterium]
MSNSPHDLYVFLHGERVGRLVLLRRGAVHLYYDFDASKSSVPLSLSLRPGRQGRSDVSSWIDGLLPENPRIRSRWARELGARSAAPFDLLCTEAGLESSGAIQFCSQPVLPDPESGTLTKLTDAELGAKLRLVSQDAESDPAEGLSYLRLSLPGAQPKIALRRTSDGWHLPSGSLATTHILKPQKGHLNPAVRDSIAVNEHLCQVAASELDLNAAHTSLEVIDGETALVVERFDRELIDGSVRRLHFEDLCQAMGLPTAIKYQEDGGPGPETVIEFLRGESGRASVSEFFSAMFYNWLIGNPDGHIKNYGLLLDGSHPKLAPLFDVSSLSPYAGTGNRAMPTAMRFAGAPPSTLDDWAQIANRLKTGVTAFTLRDIADGLPDAFAYAASQCPSWATETASAVCESIVAHAGQKIQGAEDTFDIGPRPDASRPTHDKRCGRRVRRTGKPCLLRSDHRGNCRSVL